LHALTGGIGILDLNDRRIKAQMYLSAVQIRYILDPNRDLGTLAWSHAYAHRIRANDGNSVRAGLDTHTHQAPPQHKCNCAEERLQRSLLLIH
jgi:hypothetical protein